jgi:hypothetical protein
MAIDSQVDTGPVFLSRQRNLSQAIQAAGLDSLVLNPGPSLVYLTGLNFHLMERPVVALFLPGRAPILILELDGESEQFPNQVFTFKTTHTWRELNAGLQVAGPDGNGRVEPPAARAEPRMLEDRHHPVRLGGHFVSQAS